MAKGKRRKGSKVSAILSRFPEIIGVELGVHQGRLSIALLKSIPRLHLYMIDLWSTHTYDGKGNESASPRHRKLYTKHSADNYRTACLKTEGRNRTIIREDTAKAAARFKDGSVDFVFIDADHSYEGCLRDIEAWYNKVKPGGWIGGHDYPRYPGVVKAVNEYFGNRVKLDSGNTWFVEV